MTNLRQDLSKGNYRAVIPVAVDGMAQVERPDAVTGTGGTAFVDTVTLVDQTGNVLGTSGNPVYVSGGTGPGGTSSANAIANAATQSFASGSSNFLQADLTGALKVNVVAGGGSSSTSAIANAATQSFANGTANSLQADTTGALKVNVVAGGGSGADIGLINAAAPTSASYIGQTNIAGNLVGVGYANPLATTIFGTPDVAQSGTWTVGLSAGTNAIGSITNTGFNLTSSIPAGTNAIGSITNTGFNLTSSIPAGTNAIGSITNTAFGISAGTNNIGVTGVAQGSTTTGTYGNLTQGAVTTSVPTYTTGQNSPLSLDTSGLLRVNVVSGGGATTATANAATQSFANGTANALQADTTGALKVNVVAGGSSGANIGVLGSTAPTSGNYTSFANASGNLTGVTPTTQLPVASYTSTKQVQINPTNTIGSAYSTGNCIGGKLTFPNVTRVNSGIIQSITIVSKTINSVGYKLYLFSSNPTNSTFTDKTNPSINALDLPFLIDQFAINAYDNGLGTMTIYPFDNVGRSFYSTDNSLYAILVPTAAVTYTSTTNLFITMSVMED